MTNRFSSCDVWNDIGDARQYDGGFFRHASMCCKYVIELSLIHTSCNWCGGDDGDSSGGGSVLVLQLIELSLIAGTCKWWCQLSPDLSQPSESSIGWDATNPDQNKTNNTELIHVSK